MSLSAKQYRQYKLIALLCAGKPISKDVLIEALNCSEPTFNRDLSGVRQQYRAEIRFLKPVNKYQLVSGGDLTPRLVKHLREALSVYESTVPTETATAVILDKEAKKPVSLSLRSSVIRRIELYGNRHNLNRSQVVEWLVDKYLTRPVVKKEK